MTCHQGRELTASVNKAIAGLPLDTPDPRLSFIHVHFYGAGATIYGTEAKVGYEYEGKTYVGRFAHMPNVSTCTGCHRPHGGEVLVVRCGGCHDSIRTVDDLANIRMSTRGDFDGNGKEEGLAKEIAGLQAQLYAAIQSYAKNVGGTPIGFTEAAYPHWFADTNGNGPIRSRRSRSRQQISCVHAASAAGDLQLHGFPARSRRCLPQWPIRSTASLRFTRKPGRDRKSRREYERQGSAIKPQSA